MIDQLNESELKLFRGKYVVLEGGEGAGKTSQLKRLGDHLAACGVEVVLTREPGGSPSADLIRQLLVSGDPERFCSISEVLLFAAARTEHQRATVRPALARGALVLSDRGYGSTLAYQSYGRYVPAKIIEQVHRLSGALDADLNIFLDVDPEVGLARSKLRLSLDQSKEGRFESLDIGFHQRVRDGFRDLCERNPGQWVRVDGEGAHEEVEDRIDEALADTLIPEHLRRLSFASAPSSMEMS